MVSSIVRVNLGFLCMTGKESFYKYMYSTTGPLNVLFVLSDFQIYFWFSNVISSTGFYI